MNNILICYNDSRVKDLVDETTNIKIVRTMNPIQFRVKNVFLPNQVLVIDTTIINDKDFIEWAIVNTRLDLIVMVHDKCNMSFNLKDLKKQCKHKFQVIKKEIEKKDNIFGILDQIINGVNRDRVKILLEESVGLFPLLLKWLIGSVDKFNEWNQQVIEQIDEKYMRKNTEAIIRNLAFGIKPETKFIRFNWAFPKQEDKKAKVKK